MPKPPPDTSWITTSTIREGCTSSEHNCCYHVAAAKAVLADRERELLELKGACHIWECRLHYAHSGPCDVRPQR